jgi:hypothetical protein
MLSEVQFYFSLLPLQVSHLVSLDLKRFWVVEEGNFYPYALRVFKKILQDEKTLQDFIGFHFYPLLHTVAFIT